ncbi:MMPL family transporter [uncultured Desulfobacter sp.]|uniref:efflux RND transporter permease subunit n=1 Tax=uncultured Desulfobacter sp. TaxID=240139 RepID=UPI002AABB9FD|nr:MMPL family transporter [uncultured Desulfobacter sp.]
MESLIMEDDPDLVFYEKFKRIFGEDEFIIIAFSSNDIFTPQMLSEIHKLTQKLEGIKEVKEVVSITNVESILGTKNDFFVQPLCEQIPESMEAAEEIKKRAFSLQSVKNNIISNDGKASLFLVRTLPHEGDETYDLRLLQSIDQAFKDHALADGSKLSADTIHTAGWLVTDVNMSSHINRDNQIFMPLIYAILGFFLFLTLRSAIGVAIGLFNITLCLLWTMAALYLSGGAISPMTAILSPLMMALAVSDSIHVLLHFFQKKRCRETVMNTLKETVDELWRPCFLTSLTTAIGFLSLLVSDIPPIRHFGLAAAIGMMAEFFLTMTLIPLIIYFLRNTKSVVKDYKIQGNYLSRMSNGIASFVLKNKNIILCLSTACIVGSMFGISRIKVETNLIEYFKKSSAIYKDFQFIDTRLNGVDTLEISIKNKNDKSLMTPTALNKVQAIETYLNTLPFVGTTTSVNTFIKQMNKSFHAEDPQFYSIPESAEMIAQYLLIYGGDEIYNFLNDEYTWTRISARISEHSSSELAKYLLDISSFIENNINTDDIEVRVTGKTFLVNKLLKSIVDSQMSSLLLAFIIIFSILFLVFKSFKLGGISLIPNGVPIIFNLGLMGFLGIPLNTATAIISAVAIGIAVDDTIHYLTTYQSFKNKGVPTGQAALEALKTKGEPIMVTSFILCFGFGVMVFSSFVPTIQFGFLSAAIMLFAILSDLLILPSILLAGYKK